MYLGVAKQQFVLVIMVYEITILIIKTLKSK